MEEKSAAFLSYSHLDDEYTGGRITELCKHLVAAVRLQTGGEFSIFQDKSSLAWGVNWRNRIESSLDATTLFIPVVTPNFFNSDNCLEELERFLKREKDLKRDDLVLPIYFVECPIVSDKQGKTKKHKLARLIASRQYFDWRELRFEPMDSTKVAKQIAEMADYIGQSLNRSRKEKSDKDQEIRTTEFITKKELAIRLIEITVNLNEFGDGQYTLKYFGISAKRNRRISEAILTRHTSFGSFGPFRITPYELPLTAETDLMLADDGESTQAIARVHFNELLTDKNPPINCELHTWIYGGFAVDKREQQLRHIRHIEGMEWISYTVEHEIEALVLSLHSTSTNFLSLAVEVAILNNRGTRQGRAEAAVQKTLEIEPHEVRCRVIEPRTGLRYELRWELPDPPAREQHYDAFYDARKVLIHAAEGGARSKLARHLSQWIIETREDYFRRFGGIRSEELDVSLNLLNDRKYRLKLVAGLFPSNSPLWSWEGFKPGTGLAGRAFKCNRIAFYSTLSASEDQFVYIKNTDPILSKVGLLDHAVLLSCPIYFGGSSREDIIGIINLGSMSKTSKLHGYTPGRDFDLWVKETSKSALRYLISFLTASSQILIDSLPLSDQPYDSTNTATEAVGLARDYVPLAPKTFRTLFHVTALAEHQVRAIVPAWDPRKPILFEKSILPQSIRDVLAMDYVFYAQVNLNASSAEELIKSMTAFEPGGTMPNKGLAF